MLRTTALLSLNAILYRRADGVLEIENALDCASCMISILFCDEQALADLGLGERPVLSPHQIHMSRIL